MRAEAFNSKYTWKKGNLWEFLFSELPDKLATNVTHRSFSFNWKCSGPCCDSVSLQSCKSDSSISSESKTLKLIPLTKIYIDMNHSSAYQNRHSFRLIIIFSWNERFEPIILSRSTNTVCPLRRQVAHFDICLIWHFISLFGQFTLFSSTQLSQKRRKHIFCIQIKW